MANEISLSAQITLNKLGVVISASASKQIDQAGAGNTSNIQAIGTVTEALVLTDIDDIGYIFVKNLDATNFIELGITTAVLTANAMITLKPGEFALFPTRLETIYAKADTVACNLLVVGLEL